MIVWVKSTGEYSVEMINILPTYAPPHPSPPLLRQELTPSRGTQAFAIVVGIIVPSFVM